MNKNTKKIVLIGMFSAIAYIFTLIGHLIPIAFADFLKYDPKDTIIVIAGFALGPLSALIISVLTALLELITISTTGIIGFVMNVIASATFACIPALIYKRSRKFKTAIITLLISSTLVVGFMLLWNWLITPLYMGVPREAVVEMLIPIFLPFNVLKVTLNTILTLLIYKPVVRALRQTGLLSKSDNDKSEEKAQEK
ncbi:MAG: ECF transporter S component [Clostridia bacterium]|nr:ECF transporter S component [Clostridia bacterium]